MREISPAGIDLIKSSESCRLTVYRDPVGIPTVGYGHVTDLPVGNTVSQEEAEKLLRVDLVRTCAGVESLVEVPINDNQFAALVSFAFNVGVSALKHSHLLEYLNRGDFKSASEQFPRWNKAGGKVLPGLVKRRAAEQALFLS